MASVSTAFGDIVLDVANYYCLPCQRNTLGASGADFPACEVCGGATSFNGHRLPEPIASEGWTSSAVARYWRGQKPERPWNTQLELM